MLKISILQYYATNKDVSIEVNEELERLQRTGCGIRDVKINHYTDQLGHSSVGSDSIFVQYTILYETND
jgi:hypothetical protein